MRHDQVGQGRNIVSGAESLPGAALGMADHGAGPSAGDAPPGATARTVRLSGCLHSTGTVSHER